MGKVKLVSFSLFLDAFPPRLKMPFGQRHVAINIYNICRGHFDQPCTMFFFKICAFFVYVFVCSLFFQYMPDSFYPVCIFGVCLVYVYKYGNFVYF